MTSGTVSSFLLLLLSCTPALAAPQQVQYNQVLNVKGDMTLNSFLFPDGSKVETYSQSQQQIFVNQQQPSIPANQVTGSTGSPFVGITGQSMIINTNMATNLVGGQVEMSMSTGKLQGMNVSMANTYVAMLSPDRQSWMIQETMRMNNMTDMTVRMVKRNQLDGEYMIVGRQTNELNTLVTPFSSDQGMGVNILGTGIQENEFQDGFRLSTRANQPMIMNVNVVKGVDSSMLTALQGQMSINDYRYLVSTNLGAVNPGLNQQVTVLQVPINAVRIQKMMMAAGVQSTGMVALSVAQRLVQQNPGGATAPLTAPAPLGGSTSPIQRRGEFRKQIARQAGNPTSNNPVATQLLLTPTFTPVAAAATLDTVNMRIAVPLRQLDGEYILTMQVMSGSAAPAQAPQAPAPGTQAPSTQAPSTQAPSTQAPTGSNSTMPVEAPKPMRRDTQTDQYGMPKAPAGAIIMTMQQIDQMANMQLWGGQAPVTQIMNQFMQAQSGGNGTATAGLQIIV